MSILLTYLSSLILLNLVSFFSLITNIPLSIVYSLIVFATGSVLNETSLLLYVNQRPLIHEVIKIIGWILPNFGALNIRDFVLYQNDLSFNFLLGSTAYGITYAFVLLGLSCYILTQKDLD